MLEKTAFSLSRATLLNATADLCQVTVKLNLHELILNSIGQTLKNYFRNIKTFFRFKTQFYYLFKLVSIIFDMKKSKEL